MDTHYLTEEETVSSVNGKFPPPPPLSPFSSPLRAEEFTEEKVRPPPREKIFTTMKDKKKSRRQKKEWLGKKYKRRTSIENLVIHQAPWSVIACLYFVFWERTVGRTYGHHVWN